MTLGGWPPTAALVSGQTCEQPRTEGIYRFTGGFESMIWSNLLRRTGRKDSADVTNVHRIDTDLPPLS